MATLSWNGNDYASTKLESGSGTVAINPALMPSDLWETLYKVKSMDVDDELAEKLIAMAGPRQEVPSGMDDYDHYSDDEEEDGYIPPAWMELPKSYTDTLRP